MRRILVDHARAHRALKRGAGDIVALLDMSESCPCQGQLVELRFFGGLSVAETAAALDVAPITVKRDWALARAWLHREVRGRPA
jgi:DNA-directed RNA polymerase specialized sigma24 family protein